MPEQIESKSELLPDGFKVLVNTPEDGEAAELCWVPVAFAPTPEEAIALARAEGVVPEYLSLVPLRTTRFRRDPAWKASEYGWTNKNEDFDLEYEPWIPCSTRAKTGIEVWVLEVTDDPDA